MGKLISTAVAACILLSRVIVAVAQTAPIKTADTAKAKALVFAKDVALHISVRDAAAMLNPKPRDAV